MKRIILSVFLLSVCSSHLISQTSSNQTKLENKIDSLTNIILNSDLEDLEDLGETADSFISTVVDLARDKQYAVIRRYANKVLSKRGQIKDKFLVSETFFRLASQYATRSVNDSIGIVAIAHNLFLDSLADTNIDKNILVHGRIKAQRYLSMSYQRTRQQDKAIQNLLPTIELIESIDLKKAVTENADFPYWMAYKSLFNYYRWARNYTEANNILYKYRKAAELVGDEKRLEFIKYTELELLARTEDGPPKLIIERLDQLDLETIKRSVWLFDIYRFYSTQYHEFGLYDSAKSYANKATLTALITPGAGASAPRNEYRKNITLARDNEDWKWAYGNYVRAVSYDITSANNVNQRNVGRMDSQLANERAQLELKLNVASQKNNKVLIAVGALFLLIINIVLFRYFRIAKRAKLLQENENASLRVSKELAELKKEKLESLLDYKRRQLTTTVMTTSRLNSQMTVISDKLKEIIGNEQEAPRLMDRLVREVNSNVQSQDDWAQFYKHFESVHPNFFSQVLKANPDLSNNELRNAAYVLMNLSNKEVASMHNITPESAKTARIRLKKRLNLTREDSLQSFINSLVEQPSRVLQRA